MSNNSNDTNTNGSAGSSGEKSTNAFYKQFLRYAHGVGLKGYSTHYCPGCGHGLAQKYLAETVEELRIKDNTVAISPVGCSVFLYSYMDVGNSQAPHGRAPAVALGHKFANPNASVVSYQGDGDLASIGLAEIVFAAQVGIPIAVVFANNAIYGMTGGQMAPTTLTGQKTTTSPYGRGDIFGQPFKMAELIATLDGPIYVERVALFNAKERAKAKRAIKKAMQLQVENKGFAFVEVLAECPTHLKMEPLSAMKWIQEEMLPIFPLGVKKDVSGEGKGINVITKFAHPNFGPEKLLSVVNGGQNEFTPRYAESFPTHIAKENIALKFAGAGGDGAQTAAMLITSAAINEGYDSTHIPSYGPESRGGTSYADVRVAIEEVSSPSASTPHILVAFNAPSLFKFAPSVLSQGYVIYDSSVVSDVGLLKLSSSIKLIGVPFAEMAAKLGNPLVKNVVALGALQAATKLYPAETFLAALRTNLKSKPNLIELNEKAFWAGVDAVKISLR
ncbi:MAG: 2-oxoacid:acceptor oxidoreductase family protein [Oligoflexia bacterium]|nr:2-oxoacid:acceptor oxidoreductase family protein [Oligoflexia bacterium]